MTNDPLSRPIVPPAREGHRRAFSDEDKRRIVEEASQPGASLSAVAGRYGMAARVVFRWKQELASSAAVPVFVAVQSLSTGIRRASALTTGTTDCAATAGALKKQIGCELVEPRPPDIL